jgi:alkylation response protein AidB-like acyl-CoA dehydrogenase
MEPRWDFDPAAMTTVARRDGNSFTLDGAKCMVALAAASDTFLIWAASANYDRVDGFLIARDAPGLSVGEREKNMGLKALETFAVELKGCRVGAEAGRRERRRFHARDEPVAGRDGRDGCRGGARRL